MLQESSIRFCMTMGIPYKAKNINIVSVAIDAPQDTISSLAGKLGNIDGISVKTAYSNVFGENLSDGKTE